MKFIFSFSRSLREVIEGMEVVNLIFQNFEFEVIYIIFCLKYVLAIFKYLV